MGRMFSIMSGKGGVGKSTIATSLAVCYARQGFKVALVDGDTGLRCADLMLNLQDRVIYDLNDVTTETCTLEQSLIQPSDLSGLFLLAAPQLLRPSDVKAKAVAKILSALSEQMDIVLLDAPAGVGRGLKNLLGNTAEPVIVATPDDVSVRDAERLASLLSQREEPRPYLVFNRVSPRLVRMGEMTPPKALAQYLDLQLMGVIPESVKVYRALLRHQTAVFSGDAAVEQSLEILASRLLGGEDPLPDYRPSPILRFFVRGGEEN